MTAQRIGSQKKVPHCLTATFKSIGPSRKKLHKADPERTTCGPQYFMMRVRTAVEPTPAASPITAEDVKLEVRISPPKSAPRDFFCEGPIDLKVAAKRGVCPV